jgi:hypothetical protein
LRDHHVKNSFVQPKKMVVAAVNVSIEAGYMRR